MNVGFNKNDEDEEKNETIIGDMESQKFVESYEDELTENATKIITNRTINTGERP